jgi:hypothetical protein
MIPRVLANFVDERQTYWALMVGNSPSLMADIVAIFMEETNLVKDAAGIVSSCVFQPITTDMTSHFTKNGGNALGLAGQGPLNRMHPNNSPSPDVLTTDSQ